MFQVPLYNENRILGYVSERIRRTLILYVYERESKNGSISHLIRLFFQLQHFFWGVQLEVKNLRKPYFLPIKRFGIKLRTDKYENKGLCS
uniref:InfA protein n=1 Tax=Ormosia ferruginea TaxID=2929556 RepID=A0A8S0NM02_9FABA|nr:translation initiation factor 1 [Ormosia ferruginea]BDH72858.1 infA [Ormosia ferruginea]